MFDVDRPYVWTSVTRRHWRTTTSHLPHPRGIISSSDHREHSQWWATHGTEKVDHTGWRSIPDTETGLTFPGSLHHLRHNRTASDYPDHRSGHPSMWFKSPTLWRQHRRRRDVCGPRIWGDVCDRNGKSDLDMIFSLYVIKWWWLLLNNFTDINLCELCKVSMYKSLPFIQINDKCATVLEIQLFCWNARLCLWHIYIGAIGLSWIHWTIIYNTV